VISHVDRLSSNETKIAPRSVRIAVGASGRSATVCMVASRVGGNNLTLPKCRSLSTSPWDLDQLGVPVPAPDRHGGDAKLFLHGLDEGGVGGRGAAPFLERGTTPINRISTFCCPCGGAPVATPLNMKPAPRLGEAGGAESQGVRSPGGGDGGGRANAATLYSPRAATKWWAGPQGS
jgi:hypothetical protein